MTKSDAYTITAEDTAAILATTEEYSVYIRQSTDRHYAAIIAELSQFDALSPIDRARHSIVFSIVSPKCPLELNTIITPMLVRAIMSNASESEILAIFAEIGVGLQNQKTGRLLKNAAYIRTLTSGTLDRDIIAGLAGLSMKTASMATALYDQNAEVYTLDTHMLRWLCKLAGLTIQTGTYNCSNDNRYRLIENHILNIVHNVAADVPIFLTQWAVWNDTGFGGEHKCHLPIFGL